MSATEATIELLRSEERNKRGEGAVRTRRGDPRSPQMRGY
jgi:hypothetical protein